MDKEIQDYYERRLEMFTTQAWKDLTEDWEKQVRAIDEHWHLLDPSRRDKVAGSKEELLRNLALPETTESSYELYKMQKETEQ